jgi:hypothetical protein
MHSDAEIGGHAFIADELPTLEKLAASGRFAARAKAAGVREARRRGWCQPPGSRETQRRRLSGARAINSTEDVFRMGMHGVRRCGRTFVGAEGRARVVRAVVWADRPVGVWQEERARYFFGFCV